MTDRIAEFQQNARTHQESAEHALSVGDAGHWCLAAVVNVDNPRLLAALDEVLKLHTPAVVEDAQPPFRYCSKCAHHPKWPCPEVTAISRALLGEDES